MSDASARWEQVQTLLDAALDAPAENRAGYLDRACGSDAWLRAEVGGLLDACESATDYLETPVTEPPPC